MALRKILSSDGESVFAHAVSDKTIEIKRGDHKFTVTGNDFSIVGTPSKGKKATMIIVKESKIDDTQVAFVSDEHEVDEETEEVTKKKSESEDDDKDDKKDK